MPRNNKPKAPAKPRQRRPRPQAKARPQRSPRTPAGFNSRTGKLGTVNATADTMTVSGCERTYSVVNQTAADALNVNNYVIFWPGSSGIPRLDKYAYLYSLYRVKKLVVSYKPAVGTTKDGATITAVDFGSATKPATVSALESTAPRMRLAVWQPGQLSVPTDRANTKRWMETNAEAKAHVDNAACTILSSAPVATATTAYGDIWVDYTVEFAGPTTFSTGGYVPPPASEPSDSVLFYMYTSGHVNQELTNETFIHCPDPPSDFKPGSFNWSSSNHSPPQGTSFFTSTWPTNMIMPACKVITIDMYGLPHTSSNISQTTVDEKYRVKMANFEIALDDLNVPWTGGVTSPALSAEISHQGRMCKWDDKVAYGQSTNKWYRYIIDLSAEPVDLNSSSIWEKLRLAMHRQTFNQYNAVEDKLKSPAAHLWATASTVMVRVNTDDPSAVDMVKLKSECAVNAITRKLYNKVALDAQQGDLPVLGTTDEQKASLREALEEVVNTNLHSSGAVKLPTVEE